jgi:thioredoxin reductase
MNTKGIVMSSPLPVAVIGAGPVGIAAAVHLLERGLVPVVLEAGESAGAGVRKWAHVRMFSPWRYNVDPAAARLLATEGWSAPDPEHFPTGQEILDDYLLPLAAVSQLAPHLRFDSRVVGVSRWRHDKMKNAGREDSPFLVRYLESGIEREFLASAVIDASGTLEVPNPAGAAGLPALGEKALRGTRLAYGMPDLLGEERQKYAGKRLLIVGSGHSAFNVLLAAAQLREQEAGTEIHWAVRRPTLQRVFGGGENDQLAERGRLGMEIARLVKGSAIEVHPGFHLEGFAEDGQAVVAYDGQRRLPGVDQVVVATGFRPDLSILAELRLALDPGTESPAVLAPLIDPNLHSCGTVRPHGAMELKHPEANLYVVGMKSYGRAPTFLLLTGYEQVRSVAAAIAGDWEAACRVELKLPETGVCSVQLGGGAPAPNAAAGWGGGPPPAGAAGCCAADAEAKTAGAEGCGCGTVAAPAAVIAAPVAIGRSSSCCGGA